MADSKPDTKPDTADTKPEYQAIHQMILGGAVLVRNGQLMSAAWPSVVYDNLSYKNVQGMWRFLKDNEAIRAAMQSTSQVIADEMTRFGDSYGISSGKLTRKQLEENETILDNL